MNLRASSTAINAKHIYSVLLTILIYLSLSFPAQHIKRTGWLLRNVNDCETVAGHMYRMSIMTFLLDGKNGLDRTKCMELGKLSPYRRNRPNRQWLNIYKSSCTHHNWHMTSIITVSPHYVRANKPSQAKHAKQQQNKLKAENRKIWYSRRASSTSWHKMSVPTKNSRITVIILVFVCGAHTSTLALKCKIAVIAVMTLCDCLDTLLFCFSFQLFTYSTIGWPSLL